MRKPKRPNIGSLVIFHDGKGLPHNALVKAVWGDGETPCINLVFVSGDEARQDGAGRQTEIETSVVHKSKSNVHGNYWRWPDERPNVKIHPMV